MKYFGLVLSAIVITSPLRSWAAECRSIVCTVVKDDGEKKTLLDTSNVQLESHYGECLPNQTDYYVTVPGSRDQLTVPVHATSKKAIGMGLEFYGENALGSASVDFSVEQLEKGKVELTMDYFLKDGSKPKYYNRLILTCRYK